MFRKKVWSPYLAGVVIGLLQIPAYLFAKAFLGTSSSYVKISGHLASLVGVKLEGFTKFLAGSKFTWQLALVVGVVLGAYLSSRFSGLRRREPSPVWQDYGKRNKLMPFLGGFLLIFGARLAGGCTSGHGITGASQFSVSSWIAVGMMFAAGIGFTAYLRRRAWRSSLSA